LTHSVFDCKRWGPHHCSAQQGSVAALLQELVGTLCNRRYTEKSVAYAESHDQAIVGDQTIGETHAATMLLIQFCCCESSAPVHSAL
jgi:hypothetical protein